MPTLMDWIGAALIGLAALAGAAPALLVVGL